MRLKEIGERCEAATPGPWERQPSLSLDSCVESALGESPGVPAASFDVSGLNARNDADFIAHARTDLPALLAIAQEAVTLRRLWKDKAGTSDDAYGHAAEAFWKKIDGLDEGGSDV